MDKVKYSQIAVAKDLRAADKGSSGGHSSSPPAVSRLLQPLKRSRDLTQRV